MAWLTFQPIRRLYRSLIGSLGSTDNALLRADGTAGNAAQGSAVTVDDDGNMAVPGSVSAGLKVVTQAATDTLTAAECRGCVISNYGQAAENTQILPAAAEGLHGLVVIGTAGAGAFHLKAGAGDKIYLDGKALDDGDKVSVATPAVGDNFTFFSFQTGASAYDWIVTSGSQGTLTDGGA